MGIPKLFLLGIALALAANALGATHLVELRDEVRKRNVPVKVYLPEKPGKYPAVIWSHGLGGSREHYRYLGEHFAANGYIAIMPTHFGSDASIRSGSVVTSMLALKKAADDPANFDNRPKDVSFVLDHLRDLQFDSEIDERNIVVGGHSFGAYTSLAVAGAKLRFESGEADYRDDRVKAFIAISPQGTGRAGFIEGSWSAIERPVLIIRGSADKGIHGESAEWRGEAFAGLPEGNKAEAVVSGAIHTAFIGHQPSEVTEVTKHLTLHFLDRTLRGADKRADFGPKVKFITK